MFMKINLFTLKSFVKLGNIQLRLARHTMFTFTLKTGGTVQVAAEDVEQFVQENRDNIVVRHRKRRGGLTIDGLETVQNVTA